MIACYALTGWVEASTGRMIDVACVVDVNATDEVVFVKDRHRAHAIGLFEPWFYLSTERGFDAALARNIAAAYRPEVP